MSGFFWGKLNKVSQKDRKLKEVGQIGVHCKTFFRVNLFPFLGLELENVPGYSIIYHFFIGKSNNICEMHFPG